MAIRYQPRSLRRTCRGQCINNTELKLSDARDYRWALFLLACRDGFIVWAGMRFWKPAPYQPIPGRSDWYNKGIDALRNGAFLQASKALEEAVKTDPTFALAHARLAEAYTELDYTDKAKDELLRVSSLVPDRSQLPRLDELYLTAINNTVTRRLF